MRLPPEIRCQVYRNLLSPKYTKRLSVSRQVEIFAKIWPGHDYDLDCTILRTSRQVYSEASAVLYHENIFVRVRCTHESFEGLMDLKGIPGILKGRKAESFKHCAMSVDLDRLDNTSGLQIRRRATCWIIAFDDLQLLCHVLLYHHHIAHGSLFQHYEFSITVHRLFDHMRNQSSTGSTLVRRLLEPFTVLHSVPHFKIACPVNREYCANIVAQVSRKAPTLEEWFDFGLTLREKSFEQLRQQNFKGAAETSRMAISHFTSSCSRETVAGAKWTALSPDQQAAINDAYVDVIANLALACYSLEKCEDTHFWSWFATESTPRNSTMRRMGLYAQLVYLKAMGAAYLGYEAWAVKELCEGLKVVDTEIYEKHKELDWYRQEVKARLQSEGGARLLRAIGYLPERLSVCPYEEECWQCYEFSLRQYHQLVCCSECFCGDWVGTKDPSSIV